MNNVDEITDHELLKGCATAMGFTIKQILHLRRAPHKKESLSLQVAHDNEINTAWNPLSNNHDSFDIAVSQGVTMNFCKETNMAKASISNHSVSVSAKDMNSNRHAALRRAIVLVVYTHHIAQKLTLTAASA